MSRLVNYPVHEQAVLRRDIRVRVCLRGTEDWREISVYNVKVNMHDVQCASMVYFDFVGEVLVEVSGPWYIYQADIRPLSRQIEYSYDTKTLRFILSEPANLSIELNKDRNHNLHLFAGRAEEEIPDRNKPDTLVIKGNQSGYSSFGNEVIKKLEEMPAGRTLFLESGIHFIRETIFRVPSDTDIYLAGGCILIGSIICSGTKNIHIYGRGIIYQADFQRHSGINGIRLSNVSNIRIEDIIFINPPHYTIYIGGSRDIVIKNIKAFSCEGWSDGIDIMSSENIQIQGGFLRNSDDCIAIYGSRWKYKGDSRNITVKGVTVWADVAHPLNIGTHGNYKENGDLIENITFEDIDILEHNEYQAGYLGCMAINPGDKNTVRNICYKNIRIEPFMHGKLLDFQVKYNPDYNPVPGRRIEHVYLKDIYYNGINEVTSMIRGYNEEYCVEDIVLENIVINGTRIKALEDANIELGGYAYNIRLV